MIHVLEEDPIFHMFRLAAEKASGLRKYSKNAGFLDEGLIRIILPDFGKQAPAFCHILCRGRDFRPDPSARISNPRTY